jgi:septal ring factor EnvC (AmiA/AmiB activator)
MGANGYVEKDVAVDMKSVWQLRGGIAELEREYSVAEKSQKQNSKNMKELSSEIKELTLKLNALSNTSESLPPTRKRGADDTELAECMSSAWSF